MAKLVLHGEVALVEILTDPDDGDVILARCQSHTGMDECPWQDRYDSTTDAVDDAADHADFGRG